jgi:hypothetical protein
MYGTGSGDPGFAASSWCRVKARPAPPARRQPAWRSREFPDRLAHPVRLFHVKRTSQADQSQHVRGRGDVPPQATRSWRGKRWAMRRGLSRSAPAHRMTMQRAERLITSREPRAMAPSQRYPQAVGNWVLETGGSPFHVKHCR